MSPLILLSILKKEYELFKTGLGVFLLKSSSFLSLFLPSKNKEGFIFFVRISLELKKFISDRTKWIIILIILFVLLFPPEWQKLIFLPGCWMRLVCYYCLFRMDYVGMESQQSVISGKVGEGFNVINIMYLILFFFLPNFVITSFSVSGATRTFKF